MHEYKKCEFDKIFTGMKYNMVEDDVFYRVQSYENKKGSGYAIGKCFKFTGKYKQGCKGDPYDSYEGYESSELIDRKRVDFVKVLVSFDKVVLVEKNDVRYLDEKTNDTV